VCAPFWGAGSLSNTMSPGPRPTAAPSGILINPAVNLVTMNIGRKLGGCGDGVQLGPTQHNVAWAKAYHRTKWHLDPSSRLATLDIGQKSGCCDPFFFLGGGRWSPTNAMWSGPRTTSVLSGTLTHLAVWSQ